MEVRDGYKLTEVGIIPNDWDVVSVKDVTHYIKGFPFKSNDYQSDGVRVIRVSDTNSDSIKESEIGAVYVTEESARRCAAWRLFEHDLFITTVGSKPPLYDSMVGKVILVDGIHSGTLLNQNAVILRNKKNSWWLQTILSGNFRTKRYLAHIEKIYRGNANQASITLKELFHFQIPLATNKNEQQEIACALSNTDSLLAKLNQLITKKRDLKLATMQQLLTGQTRLAGFCNGWKVRKLDCVVEIDPENIGSNTPPDFEFNYIALENVDCGMLRGYSQQIFATAPSRARRKLKFGDVLVSTVRPNLRSHLLFAEQGDKWICSTGFCVIRAKEGITNPAFIFFHFFANYVNDQIENLLTGSNYPAINSRDVRELEIPLPDVDEQNAIAEVLIDMDAEITALEHRRTKTLAIKQAMMQELLTGKTRLISKEENHA